MDYDKLIEELREYTYWLGQSGPESHDIHPAICDNAATALEASWYENQALRGLIRGLDAELSHVRSDLAQIKAERDAAVADLRKWNICGTCKHYNPHGKKSHCKIKEAYLPGGNWAGCSKWEWKGIGETSHEV